MPTENAETRLQRIEDDIREIKGAVCGNPKVGLTGLVKRVAWVEARLKSIDLRMASIGGGTAVVIWLITHLSK